MNSSPQSLPKNLLWILPCVVWLAAAGFGIGRTEQLAQSNDSTGAGTSNSSGIDTAEVGFYTEYQASSSHWRWRYTREMSTGCERLVLRSDNPVAYDEDANVVTIDLMTYNTDDLCTQPKGLASYSGGISTDKDTQFKVNLDGKQVFP